MQLRTFKEFLTDLQWPSHVWPKVRLNTGQGVEDQNCFHPHLKGAEAGKT